MKTMVCLMVTAILITSCGREETDLATESQNAYSAISVPSKYTPTPPPVIAPVATYPSTSYPTIYIIDPLVAAGAFTCSYKNGACTNGQGGSTCKLANGSYGFCSGNATTCGCVAP